MEYLERKVLAAVQEASSMPAFDDALAAGGCEHLVRSRATTLQVNMGRLCNQACSHCHVDAGPTLTDIMTASVVARTLTVLAASTGISTVDITGGAPELNPNFRQLVVEAHRLGCQVIDRCNLTVLIEPGMEQLPEFLAKHQVEIYASMPCYTACNVEKQRGLGSFSKSIHAIQLLNALGYGMPESRLKLNLVYNPLGAFLPPPQKKLEEDYRRQLCEHHGVEFNRLFTITNMPIGRFAIGLHRTGRLEDYIGLLVSRFNPNTVANLMCRSQVSVGYDGKLYDCDFNQMLGIGIESREKSIWTVLSFDKLEGRRIVSGRHCFGCTAGPGSSCGGSLQ